MWPASVLLMPKGGQLYTTTCYSYRSNAAGSSWGALLTNTHIKTQLMPNISIQMKTIGCSSGVLLTPKGEGGWLGGSTVLVSAADAERPASAKSQVKNLSTLRRCMMMLKSFMSSFSHTMICTVRMSGCVACMICMHSFWTRRSARRKK